MGDAVVAMGSPFGLEGTVTSGIVSALHRQMTAPNNFRILDSIQTDAAINHGNSGGPLLDQQGRVIGVNAQIESESGGSDGVGFAIPSNTVRSIASQLIESGEAEHAYLGVSMVTVSEGAAITEVRDGTPAEKAGLKAATDTRIVDGQEIPSGGDIVVEFDGQEISTSDELQSGVDAKQPGDTVSITVLRNGDRRAVPGDSRDAAGADPVGVEPGWRSVRLDEIDPIRVVGGTLLWRPVRLTLDIGAFGINAYTAPNAGDDVIEQHTEKLYRHEEVYVVLSGRATFTLGDETLDAPAGTVVFIRDPTVRRHARADGAEHVGPRRRRPARRGLRAFGLGGARLLRGEASRRRRLRGGRRRDLARARTTSRRSGPALRPRLRRGARGTTGGGARARAPRTRAEAGVRSACAEGSGPREPARAPWLAALTLPRQDGVTRYASNTASRFLSAVRSERSSFTSPTSAVYQFRAIPSSTVPP